MSPVPKTNPKEKTDTEAGSLGWSKVRLDRARGRGGGHGAMSLGLGLQAPWIGFFFFRFILFEGGPDAAVRRYLV